MKAHGRACVYEPHSIFVLLPGMSHEDAFVAGQAMADRITALNPKPVKLKFEKVGPSWRAGTALDMPFALTTRLALSFVCS